MTRLIRLSSVVIVAISAVVYIGSSVYVKTHTNRKGPEIQMDQKELVLSIKSEEKDMLAGVTATDKKDGDVTKSLVVESVGTFIEKGTCQISIAAFDSDHNVSKATRTIKYKDYVSPRISLKKPLRAPVNAVDELIEGIRVKDCLEGDVTDTLQITPQKEDKAITTPGEYKMKLLASNQAGDVVEYPVTVELYDYAANGSGVRPVLSKYFVYTKVGKSIDPMKYLVGVDVNGKEYLWKTAEDAPVQKSEISIENPVDYQKAGTYEISYTAKDSNKNSGTVRLVVVVEK